MGQGGIGRACFGQGSVRCELHDGIDLDLAVDLRDAIQVSLHDFFRGQLFPRDGFRQPGRRPGKHIARHRRCLRLNQPSSGAEA
jgi:hypothetical protein